MYPTRRSLAGLFGSGDIPYTAPVTFAPMMQQAGTVAPKTFTTTSQVVQQAPTMAVKPAEEPAPTMTSSDSGASRVATYSATAAPAPSSLSPAPTQRVSTQTMSVAPAPAPTPAPSSPAPPPALPPPPPPPAAAPSPYTAPPASSGAAQEPAPATDSGLPTRAPCGWVCWLALVIGAGAGVVIAQRLQR